MNFLRSQFYYQILVSIDIDVFSVWVFNIMDKVIVMVYDIYKIVLFIGNKEMMIYNIDNCFKIEYVVF